VLEDDEEDEDEDLRNDDNDEDKCVLGRRDSGFRDNSMAASTETFRFKTKNTLLQLEKEQQELTTAESSEKRSLGLPPIDSSSFNDLATDALDDFIDTKNDIAESSAEAIVVAPSVADLTQFWAKTTSAMAVVRSPSSATVGSIEPTSVGAATTGFFRARSRFHQLPNRSPSRLLNSRLTSRLRSRVRQSPSQRKHSSRKCSR
jgi:hypothetical protein